jgi:N-acetylglucosaminyldiphosphoundecaprenol N-acetyl-beta-D-mannosaminyltransferase
MTSPGTWEGTASPRARQPGTDRQFPRVDFLGMPFHRLTIAQTLEWMEARVRTRVPSMVFCPNVALLVWARKDRELRGIYESCDLLPVDGMGIYYASKLTRQRFPEACSGLLLMFELLKQADVKGYRIFLLGARANVLEQAVRNIRARYPGAVVAGCHHGFFTEKEASAVARQVSESGADFLFVAMSSPLKERFVSRYLREMNVPVALGVGGAVDIIAGVRRLAPHWVRRAGMEWVFRLAQEPRRMWRRYLFTNFLFGILVAREGLSRLLHWK